MPQTTNRQLTLKKKIGHAFVHQSTNTTLNTESHLKMILKDLPEDSLSIKESTNEQSCMSCQIVRLSRYM